MNPIERFLDKVSPEPNSGCWLWTGAATERNYGSFYADGRTWQAHRWHYEYLNGKIPPGLQIDHLCRVTCCVNPGHLEPVTGKENTRRGAAIPGNFGKRGRNKTHCPQGHPYSPGNTYFATQHGGRHAERRCKTCGCEKGRARYYRKKMLDGREADDA